MKNLMKKRLNKKGFTLIELVVVVAILGILAVVAIPRFANIRANSEAQANEATAVSIVSAAEVCYQNTGAEPVGADSAAKITWLVANDYLRSAPTGGTFVLSGSTGTYQCTYTYPAAATGFSGVVGNT